MSGTSSGKALMACAHHWASPFQVGSHHLARGLVRAGFEVAFVSDPVSPLHVVRGLARPDLRERFASYRAGGRRDLGGRLWSYVPASLLAPCDRPFLRREWVHRHWARLTVPDVVRTAARNGFDRVDLLYFDSPHHAFWLDAVPHRRSVFRVADNNSTVAGRPAAERVLERELAQAVDAVVYTARTLAGYVESLRPRRAFHLPNGVDFEHFASGSRAMPPEYADVPRPRVVYVGAIDAWFDFDLVDEAAAALPTASFVLIGPPALARARLAPRANVHLLGPRPHGELPRYLHNADVGIIPFDVARHPDLVHGINPLKLYEYMACGLPVVATAWNELRRLDSPAILCEREAFVRALGQVLAAPPSPEAHVPYARGMDWSRQVRALVDGLGLGAP